MEGRQRGREQAGSSQGGLGPAGSQRWCRGLRNSSRERGGDRATVCEPAQLAVFTDICRFLVWSLRQSRGLGLGSPSATLTHSRWPDWALVGPQPLAT